MDNSCLHTRLHGALLCIWNFAMRVTFHKKQACQLQISLTFYSTFHVISTAENAAYAQTFFLFVFIATVWRFWIPPLSQILSYSYTSNICLAQLLWGIAGYGSARHTTWRMKDCRKKINIFKIISCEGVLFFLEICTHSDFEKVYESRRFITVCNKSHI